eukprot:scaffold133289_cov56-Phaeocystis_antarctica.AAC.1
MTEVNPETESKSNAPPKVLVNDEEEGVANATGNKDEQPEPRNYKWLAVFFMSVALVSIFANAGLTIAIVTKAFGMHAPMHAYTVSLTSAGGSVVAKVPCVEVLEAIVSIQNGDADQGLVMIPLGNGELSTPSMSAAHYQVHEDSFGMEQIFLSGDRDVSYNVTCATSMAACETHPSLLCDVLPSAAPASSPEALSFEDAFDGDVRRRLSHFNGRAHKAPEGCEKVGCVASINCPPPYYEVHACAGGSIFPDGGGGGGWIVP